jgi:hypothetical protein
MLKIIENVIDYAIDKYFSEMEKRVWGGGGSNISDMISEKISGALLAKLPIAIANAVYNKLADPYCMSYLLSYKSCAEFVNEHVEHASIFPKEQILKYRDFCLHKASDDGLFLEFGVFNGNSINYFATKRPQITFHGFDSFQGLPDNWAGTARTAGGFDLQGKMPIVKENVILHKGWFNETLPLFCKEHATEKISFVHIDSDLYSSAKTIFNNLKEMIRPGTIIMFDELIMYPAWQYNEVKAFIEFVNECNIQFRYIAFCLSCGAVIVDNIKY